MSPRQMAAILGNVRSFFTVMSFLRAFTDQMCEFVNLSQRHTWDEKLLIPNHLRLQITEDKNTILSWTGRPFTETSNQTLYSDSSSHGWAGIYPHSIKLVHEFWRGKVDWHINIKELLAATHTVLSLARPGHTIVSM